MIFKLENSQNDLMRTFINQMLAEGDLWGNFVNISQCNACIYSFLFSKKEGVALFLLESIKANSTRLLLSPLHRAQSTRVFPIFNRQFRCYCKYFYLSHFLFKKKKKWRYIFTDNYEKGLTLGSLEANEEWSSPFLDILCIEIWSSFIDIDSKNALKRKQVQNIMLFWLR